MLSTVWSLLQSLSFFAGYIKSGNTFPEPFSPDEEKKYIERLENGDEEARSALIEHNLRLVAHIAKKYANAKRDTDDLISIGSIGLIKAVSTYKSGRGNTMATYASKCIENEILMSLRAEKKTAWEISWDEPIGTDKDGNEISLSDILGSDTDQTHDAAERSINSVYLSDMIDKKLNPRERLVVRLRYGIPSGCPMPQREVAALLGISRSYVSRLEKKALKRLSLHIPE